MPRDTIVGDLKQERPDFNAMELTFASTECMKTPQCAPLKHHYDECAERVQQQEEEHGKAQEDCVEECKSFLRIKMPSCCILIG
jgi:hypothetical protein